MEGVRPPVQRKTLYWKELYPLSEKEERTKTSGLRPFSPRPRTWPADGAYESIVPRKRGPKQKPSKHDKDKEPRHIPTHGKHCQPVSKWHSYSFPTCNNMHEFDFVEGLVPPTLTLPQDPLFDDTDTTSEVFIEYKFSGASRSAWMVHSVCTDGSDCVAPGLNATEKKKTGPQIILKTLNWNMVWDEVVFEHQRIDALASERLTSSPHIIDIYGFCGGSVLNEFADGGSFGKMVRRWNETSIASPEERLEYARDAALGLGDIHEIDGRGNMTTFIHHDYSGKNMLTVNGKLKISDFNDGQLLRWDVRNKKRCNGFFWDGKCGNNRERTHRRAPEECMGDKFRYYTSEKVEVYHLGSFLFYLLTGGGWPYQYEVSSKGVPHKPTSKKVKKLITTGVLPALPLEIQQSNDTATKAMIQAMKWACTFSPRKRPSARAVGLFLDRKLKAIRGDTGVDVEDEKMEERITFR